MPDEPRKLRGHRVTTTRTPDSTFVQVYNERGTFVLAAGDEGLTLVEYTGDIAPTTESPTPSRTTLFDLGAYRAQQVTAVPQVEREDFLAGKLEALVNLRAWLEGELEPAFDAIREEFAPPDGGLENVIDYLRQTEDESALQRARSLFEDLDTALSLLFSAAVDQEVAQIRWKLTKAGRAAQ